MDMVELRLYMIIAINPQLINSINRFINQPLFKKYSVVPFNE